MSWGVPSEVVVALVMVAWIMLALFGWRAHAGYQKIFRRWEEERKNEQGE